MNELIPILRTTKWETALAVKAALTAVWPNTVFQAGTDGADNTYLVLYVNPHDYDGIHIPDLEKLAESVVKTLQRASAREGRRVHLASIRICRKFFANRVDSGAF